MLWDHFEQVMDDQHKIKHSDESRAIDFNRQEEFSIVDITFAKTDTNDTILLDELNKLRLKKEKITQRLDVAKTEKAKASINKDFAKVDQKYKAKRNIFY